MPMILVKKNPRGKVIRELSNEEETAVKMVCGLKKPATMAQRKRLARTVLIFTESSDQLSRATDRVPGLPASPGYAQ